VISAAFGLGLLEGFCRLTQFDFAQEERKWRAVPPYWRAPIIPSGEAFFRRPGPEPWAGQVLNIRVQQLHIFPNPYTNEPAVTLVYDEQGFRNEGGWTDWEVAIAGDSFTEQGYLTSDQMFTTILGKLINARVLNLGVSYTGPLSQLSYLRDYGIAK